MGLDVFLYHFTKDIEKVIADEQSYRDAAEEIWQMEEARVGAKSYACLTEDERQAIRAKTEALRDRLGLDERGESPDKEKIAIDSASYPDHYFKVGYWRSSYNATGINEILEQTIGRTLFNIFPNLEPYAGDPMPEVDWEEAKGRAEDFLARFIKYLDENGSYHVTRIPPWSWDTPDTPQDEAGARAIFRKEREKAEARPDDPFGNSYSTSYGFFWLDEDPASIRAAIPGVADGRRCLFLIRDVDKEDMDWYVHALEIVIETIDYVLAQPDPSQYRLYWGG